MPKRRTLSIDEAAVWLKIETGTLQNWLSQDKEGIRSIARKISGPVFFWEDELIEWIDQHRLEPRQ